MPSILSLAAYSPFLPLIAVAFVAVGMAAIALAGTTMRPRLWDRFGVGFVLIGLVTFGVASSGIAT